MKKLIIAIVISALATPVFAAQYQVQGKAKIKNAKGEVQLIEYEAIVLSQDGKQADAQNVNEAVIGSLSGLPSKSATAKVSFQVIDVATVKKVK